MLHFRIKILLKDIYDYASLEKQNSVKDMYNYASDQKQHYVVGYKQLCFT